MVAQSPTPMPFPGQCVPESAILPAGVFSLREWESTKWRLAIQEIEALL